MAVVLKRATDEFAVPSIPSKRSRTELANQQRRQRLSSLMSPIVQLVGHAADVFTAQFSPDGTAVASAGFDRSVFLWNVYGECENFAVLKGHTGAILEVQFSTDGMSVFSCGTDKNIRVWDMETGACSRRWKSHQSIVNSVCPVRRGPQLACSASDDGTVKVWDLRQRTDVHSFQNVYQATAVAWNDQADQIISGGIDNDIKVWDLRNKSLAMKMRGHTDTVTGLRLSPDGNYVLSNSMDNTLRIWDVRPFAPEMRCVKTFQGHQHNFEKNLLRCAWSTDGSRVSAGSADRFVYVWDVATRKILYKLPGHNGSVNQTDFHPVENIILSASSDNTIYLGEIE